MKHLERYIQLIDEALSSMPDKRVGSNTQYRMRDIGLAAFSLFFMQQPSFLAFQRTLNQNIGKDNTQTLFGMEKIPSDNHIRKMLDGVNPSHFDKVFFSIIDDIQYSRGGITNSNLGNYTLIAIDGSEYFCSQKLSCPNCSTRKLSNGTTEYFHRFLSATIVSPEKRSVFNLPPEFIIPQDGDIKQDCELKAFKRWLGRVSGACDIYNPIYLGDDLYAHHDICSMILSKGHNFIFTCKDSSHKTLTEFRNGLKQEQYTEIRTVGKDKKEYRYSWLTQLPIRDGKDSLLVNWISIEILSAQGKRTYHSSFITNLTPTRENIAELVACARTRWKIENETFNVLKHHGYNLEHNFGHGQETLSCVLVVLNLLAFLLHNACDSIESMWQEAQQRIGARKRFFIHLWSISTYHVFLNWNSLMRTIITGRPPPNHLYY